MIALKKILNGLLYALLVLILGIQALAMFGVYHSDIAALQDSVLLIPAWIGAILLIAASFVLYKVGLKKGNISLTAGILGCVGAVLALAVALTLKAALQEQSAANNISLSGSQGMNDGKLLVRHYSLVLVGIITAVVSFVRRHQLRDRRTYEENHAYEDQFAPDEDLPAALRTGKKQRKK